jgi:hypothetical protein
MGHTPGRKGFSSIKRMISSVNHGSQIKMIAISPCWEKEKGIEGSFHHKVTKPSLSVNHLSWLKDDTLC